MGDVLVFGFQVRFNTVIMSYKSSFVAWITTATACGAWVAVVLFAMYIQSMQADHETRAQETQQRIEKKVQTTYTHAVVTATADARAQLDALVNVDPASLSDLINGAGKVAGVSVQITNALSESASALNTKAGTQAFSFNAVSQGTFGAVVYAAGLLETLPVPSSVERLDFVHTPGIPGVGGDSGWHLSAQVKIVTASSISS
jgi:hypothetical protein